MIHRITYADGSYNEWYEPGRSEAMPSPKTEPEFHRRVVAAIQKNSRTTAGILFNHYAITSSKPA